MAATHNPIVFVHGYSDKGASWQTWRDILARRLGLTADDLRTVTYVSLNNEVTIKDIAEGFDRALTVQGGLREGQAFDAIVHSTGMQVVTFVGEGGPETRRPVKASDRIGTSDVRLASCETGPKLAWRDFQGEQTSWAGFPECRKPCSGQFGAR